ncbi:hypothetical protein BpHYR1_009482 [Brachionus plicatilis]|uniref:Uncharacterized protein n=1 Tax=Brachionus plicatilis TaxID=10195 RepID=A0A3M7S0C0_BRAPC|nr:hypothetical protein BpHYR1_009482 [Brachionus plicatilis]
MIELDRVRLFFLIAGPHMPKSRLLHIRIASNHPIESLDSDDNEDESENFNTETLTVKENNEKISNDDETNDELEESFEEIRQKVAELELKTVKEKAVFYKEMALALVESSEEAKLAAKKALRKHSASM